jgi:predicted nucleotidyltransferase
MITTTENTYLLNNEVEEDIIEETSFTRNLAKYHNKLVYGKTNIKLNSLSFDIIQNIIAQITNEHKELPIFRFKIKDLENKLGRKITNSDMKTTINELLNLKTHIINEDNEEIINWFSSAKFSLKIKRDRWFDLKLSTDMNDYLLDLKRSFTLVETIYFLKIKNPVAKRIYLILKNRLDIASKNKENSGTYIINVDNLIDKLGFPEDSNYRTKFNNFYRRILIQAQDQINEFSDIKISIIIPEKKGTKKVEKIMFKVELNQNNAKQIKRTTTKKPKKDITNEFDFNTNKKAGVAALENWLNN